MSVGRVRDGGGGVEVQFNATLNLSLFSSFSFGIQTKCIYHRHRITSEHRTWKKVRPRFDSMLDPALKRKAAQHTKLKFSPPSAGAFSGVGAGGPLGVWRLIIERVFKQRKAKL